MKKPTITVLGIELTEEHFPHLYRIAQKNPEGLAEQLQGWAKTSGSTDLRSVAVNLEHDLQHELGAS